MYEYEHDTVLIRDARVARRLMESSYDPMVRAYTLAEQQAHESLWQDTDQEIMLYEYAPGILVSDGQEG
jgi:hypothetical protein